MQNALDTSDGTVDGIIINMIALDLASSLSSVKVSGFHRNWKLYQVGCMCTHEWNETVMTILSKFLSVQHAL